MMKIAVSILSLVVIASAGGPVSYSTFTPSSSYTFSSGAVAAPVTYAQQPLLRSGPAYAGYSAGYAAAPVASYSAGPVLRSAPAYAGYSAGYAAAPVASYSAGIAYAQPAAVVKTIAPEPYDAHPQYNYGYSVSDGYTGDQKSHSESRDGDVVQGQYSLVEPDGAIRTVTYTADAINGFNAVVNRQAPQVAVKQVVQAVPTYSAPAYATGFAKAHF